MSDADSTQADGAWDDELNALLQDLGALRAAIVSEATAARQCVDEAHPDSRASALNLLHYLALRRRDMRPLQQRLAVLGLSSLGRAEPHVLASIDAVLTLLLRMQGTAANSTPIADAIDFATGAQLLPAHANRLLGLANSNRNVRIMVTMPSAAADDDVIIRDLLQNGMDCIRVNCAHDDPAVWARIIENLRQARRTLGKRCKVAMDLAGPKLRTGPLEPGPQVLRIRPDRDVYGHVTALARVWLTSDATRYPAPSAKTACLTPPALWLARLQAGDSLTLRDARESRRTLHVVDVAGHGCWAEADQTVYVIPGMELRHVPKGHKGKGKAARVGRLPEHDNPIVLRRGDLLMLTRDQSPGRPATFDGAGELMAPARIGCTLSALFDDVRQGESIWFDDGKIGGIIDKAGHHALQVRITHARDSGDKLRADKGINLPDSALKLAAMTDKDIDDLAFVAQHADIVELSFANRAEDVALLQGHLARLGQRQPAIVLKIETRCGFDNLPEMLLTAMRSPSCGVMIARGDLAVESGFERLAELQEEMLWLCEAAHVPVIWATQVLETLAQTGRPSRAEITDAAMGDRAECVMLNKGPHIVDALKALDNILQRMQAHQSKKQSMLRKLNVAQALSIRLNPIKSIGAGPMPGSVPLKAET